MSSKSPTATVFVIEDDSPVRRSMQSVVEEMGLATKAYSSVEDYLEDFDPEKPGCILSDLNLPGMSGMDLVNHLRAGKIPTPVILITAFGDAASAVLAMKGGVVDYLEKPPRPDEITDCIRRAIEQDAEARLKQVRYSEIRARIDSLTPREKQVLDLIVQGYASKRIAFELGVSPRTVDKQRGQVMAKLDADNAVELTRMVLWFNSFEV